MRLATIAITVFLAWLLPAAAVQAGTPDRIHTAEVSSAAGSASAKKKSLARALRKCRTIRKVNRRKSCIRKVRRAAKRRQAKPAKPKPPKPGTMHRVDVLDTYEEDWFSPSLMTIKAGDSLEFFWSDQNQNPHNISLVSSPPGIDRRDYATPNAPSRNYRWVRRLDKAGTWNFVCSLHHLMTLTVNVEK